MSIDGLKEWKDRAIRGELDKTRVYLVENEI
jgi:hypothetical protein